MNGTRQLVAEPNEMVMDALSAEPVFIGEPNPWRIMFTIRTSHVRLIIDLSSPLVMGRTSISEDGTTYLDLDPFNAESGGVSRRHLIVKLEGGRVVVMDNHSRAGSTLNGKHLMPGQPYAIQHGDLLALGSLEMQVGLLINPLQ